MGRGHPPGMPPGAAHLYIILRGKCIRLFIARHGEWHIAVNRSSDGRKTRRVLFQPDRDAAGSSYETLSSPSVSSIEVPQGSVMKAEPMLFKVGNLR